MLRFFEGMGKRTAKVFVVSLVGGMVSQIPLVYAQSVPPVIAPEPAEGGAAPENNAPIRPKPGQATVRNIVVQGAQRIERETVLSYLALKEGDPIDASRINKSLKTLFATGLFADVAIHQEGQDIVIRVVENPIINRVAFEGNKRVKDDVLEAETQLRPRVVYTRTRVQSDVRRILEVYRRSGRFAARVEPKVIQKGQNRVDLVYEIEEGPDTGVHKISFIGNRFVSDSALRDEIITKETRWYRFLSNADTYDPDKLTFDRELLRRFYLANGFADFRVSSAVAELSEDRTGFFLTFTVEEGDRYRFGDFNVVSKIKDIDPEPLKQMLELKSGDWYNADQVDETILKMTDFVGSKGYAFVDIRPVIERDRENKTINITFEILDAPKVYVERIDIRGNVRTMDKVIRREFQLVEGDAFNTAKLRRSRDRIRALGFFKSAEVNNIPGSRPDSTIVQVDVEEQSTGEISVGAGFSTTSGLLGEVAFRERNLLGKGQDLKVATSLGQKETTLDLSFTEPYFLDKELSAGFDAFHTVKDEQDRSSYDSRETGGALRLGYNITDYGSQSLHYRFSRETIKNVDDSASIYVKAQEGTESVSSVGHTLSYDRRNSKADPTSGYKLSLSNDVAGLGGTVNFFRTKITGSYYYPFTKSTYLITGASIGHIVGLGEDVRLNDRFYLGGDDLRGFESGGVGPRDVSTKDALGGNQYASGSVELRFPLGLPDEFGLTGAAFSDFGTLRDVDETGSNIKDVDRVRASVGVGVNWQSPSGPVRVAFSQAIRQEDFDETEVFRFSFGTRF